MAVALDVAKKQLAKFSVSKTLTPPGGGRLDDDDGIGIGNGQKGNGNRIRIRNKYIQMGMGMDVVMGMRTKDIHQRTNGHKGSPRTIINLVQLRNPSDPSDPIAF